MRILRAAGRGLVALWAAVRFSGRGLAGAGRLLGRGLGPARRALGRSNGPVMAAVVAVILSFVAFGTSGTLYDTARLGWGLMPFVGAIVGLPFALVATRPQLGLLVSVAAAFVLTALPMVDVDPWPWLVVHGLVTLALLFATCARGPVGNAVGAWLVTAALFYWGVTPDVRAGWLVGVSIVAVLGLLVGRLVSANRALAVQAELSSAEKARRVVLEERARIARDLHDIVAHHMSLVVVQAETAGYRVPDLSQAARAELLSIGESARSALAETRSLLAVLRQDGAAPADAPQPGLAQIADLAESARRAGTRLDAAIDGDLDRLAPGVALAVYRIAQEGLANASRHAPGAPVRLTLDATGPQVLLEVANGPVPGGPGPDPGPVQPGHGITGMRERAVTAGAELWVGPLEDGGFAVRLSVPAAAAPSARAQSAG